MTRKPDPSSEAESKRRYVRRRRYKVDSFPEDAQAFIFGGFINGTPYHVISSKLRARGIRISANSLCKYWKECWQEEYDFLRHARACVVLIARALKQDPEGDLARIGRELLYAMVFQKAPFLKAADPFTLLHEAQEIDKLQARRGSGAPPPPAPSALSEEELDLKIREIYGLPEPPQPHSRRHAHPRKT